MARNASRVPFRQDWCTHLQPDTEAQDYQRQDGQSDPIVSGCKQRVGTTEQLALFRRFCRLDHALAERELKDHEHGNAPVQGDLDGRVVRFVCLQRRLTLYWTLQFAVISCGPALRCLDMDARSIGRAVSSGRVRLLFQDVIDRYDRVKQGGFISPRYSLTALTQR